MPVYQFSPINKRVRQAVPGFPTHILGSFDTDVAPTRMNVSTVALTSPTATVVGTVIEGNAPVVGQLISIAGAVPSYFNVTNATITGVTQVNTPDNGVYSVTFALTNSNIGTTNSPGLAVAPQVETGDSITLGNAGGGNWSSQQLAIQSNTGPNDGRSVRFDISFPILPNGNLQVVAQSADLDLDSEYQDLATVASVTGGVVTGGAVVVAQTLQRFVRFNLRNITNPGTGTIVGKITV